MCERFWTLPGIAQFMAAAAYNGGPGRVSRWLAGGGPPTETRNYVIQITRRTADHWAETASEAQAHPGFDVSESAVHPLRAALDGLSGRDRSKPNRAPTGKTRSYFNESSKIKSLGIARAFPQSSHESFNTQPRQRSQCVDLILICVDQ
jgi:hypothetical protein